MSEAFEDNLRFCQNCNFALLKFEIEMMRFDYDCPNCKSKKVSSFYSVGSRTHNDILDGALKQSGVGHKPLHSREVQGE